MAAISIGTPGTNTNPAIAIGNGVGGGITPTWTILLTETASGIAGVSGSVLAVASQLTSGAASGPYLVAVDNHGNLGLSGSVNAIGSASISGSATILGNATIAGAATISGNTTIAGSAIVDGSVTIGGTTGVPIFAGSGMPTTTSNPSGSLYLRSDADSTGPRLYQFQSNTVTGAQWLEIPVGLGVFNVKDYGAFGKDDGDDTVAIQSAINAAENYKLSDVSEHASGAIVYFPPGLYPIYASPATTGTPLTITGANNLTLAGVGSASQIMAYSDLDVFYAPSGADGLTIRDMQIQYDTKLGALPNGGLSGAAMNFGLGGLGQFRIENVDTANVGIGLLDHTVNGQGRITNCTLKGNLIAAYISSSVEIHHSHLNGGTYALVADGANGLKMTNVGLFGQLSLATWSTGAGGLNQNSLYCYDVEGNYQGDPYSSLDTPYVTTGTIDLSGVGSVYTFSLSGNAVPNPGTFGVGFPVYVRDSANDQLGGFATSFTTLSPSAISVSLVSNLESGSSLTSPATGWLSGPLYPSQVGGEGVGSAWLVATGSEVHLVDCWFRDATLVGGTPPGLYTTTTNSLVLSGKGSTYTVDVVSSSGFTVGAPIFIIDGSPKTTGASILGILDDIPVPNQLNVTSTVENFTPPTSAIASGAFISVGQQIYGLTYVLAPEVPSIQLPFVPSDVTIAGGNWSVRGGGVYSPAASIANDAIGIVQGSAVTIGHCNIFTSQNASGFGVNIHPDAGPTSIVGNNVTTGNMASGAINIAPSGNVNCQSNLIAGSVNTITWPEIATTGLIVARNPGFNPSGIVVEILLSSTSGSAVAIENIYGVPGTFYPKNSSITDISIFGTSTGLTSGSFHAEPAGSISVTWAGTSGTVLFIGD